MTAGRAAQHCDLFAAIHDALSLPAPTLDDSDRELYRVTLEARADAVRIAAGTVGLDDQPAVCAEWLRGRVAQLPVTYRVAIVEADSHPGDVTICGPGCCADVLGVHVDCPGPRAGAEVRVR